MKTSAQSDSRTRFSQSKLRALEDFLKKEGIELPPEEVPLKKLGLKRAPLSYAQQRLWFIHQLHPSSTAYHMPTAVRLEGHLNLEGLERSLNELVRQHEVLRTRFVVGASGEVEQVVMPEEEIKFDVVEVPGSSQDEWLRNAAALARQEFEKPFDLNNGRPFRTCLFRMGPEEQILLFVIHHIASDAWSQDLLLSEVKRLYAAAAKGESIRLEDPPLQYVDYSVWQREWLGSGAMEKQLQYWRQHLEGIKGILELPADHPRPSHPSTNGARYQVPFDESVNAGVKLLARAENVSLFMLLLTALQVLLSRYTGEKDIAVGIPIANRSRPEMERLIGIFVNTLVMRTVISSQESFRSLIQRVKETVLNGFAHQDVPFEKLVEELKPERSPRHSPLFQVMLDVQNSHRQDSGLEGLTGVMHYLLRTESKFDLTIFLNFDETAMRCTAEFRTELFERETMVRLCTHYQELLRSCIANPNTSVVALPLLTQVERAQMAYEWNQTGVQRERRTVVEMFEEQVRLSPEAIAVEDAKGELSYRELNRRANRWGRYLQKLGVGPEILVGICMERSRELVVGLLGILKAGAAYVPLDPGYPEQRLRYMMEKSGLQVVLVE